MAGQFMTTVSGNVRKMATTLDGTVAYEWCAGDQRLPLNDALGCAITIEFLGIINCVHCQRVTKKSFNQGYCYPCFQRLAQCDSCIVKPEKCHFHEGTCREPEWGQQHCNIDHVVYLANTSSAKVGITRGTQVPTRWMDQGATQARPIARVQTRQQSGLLEVAIGAHISDKTAWQTMLKGNGDPIDLAELQAQLASKCSGAIEDLQSRFGLNAIQWLDHSDDVYIDYPVLNWPTKVKAHNLDKTPVVEGTLMGIKGQYLMLDTGVINIRKYGGYQLALSLR
jgi:hypothetical protein